MARPTPLKGWRTYLPISLLPTCRPSCRTPAACPRRPGWRPAMITSRSTGRSLPKNSFIFTAASRATWTTQRLWAMKLTFRSGTSRVKGMVLRSAAVSGLRSRASSQVLAVASRSRVSLDPLELRPQGVHLLVHVGSLPHHGPRPRRRSAGSGPGGTGALVRACSGPGMPQCGALRAARQDPIAAGGAPQASCNRPVDGGPDSARPEPAVRAIPAGETGVRRPQSARDQRVFLMLLPDGPAGHRDCEWLCRPDERARPEAGCPQRPAERAQRKPET